MYTWWRRVWCWFGASLFTGMAGEAVAQTTIHVDWVTGNDTTGIGSSGRPYKTITKALSTVTANNTTVEVVGGTNAIHQYVSGGGGETFPLTIPPYDNFTLKGTRVPPPTITATSFQGQTFGGLVATICVDNSQNTGCVLEHLRITNVGYDKASGSDPQIRGIWVRDIPSGGTITIRDCEVLDSFHGIYVDETIYEQPTLTRTVTIEDCVIKDNGPVNPDLNNDQGHAGIRLLEADDPTIDLFITDCHLEGNHDAVEPGLATTVVDGTMFYDNENAFELASLNDPLDILITDSCFRENACLDPAVGGSMAGGQPVVTGAFVARDLSGGVVKIRNTDFDKNQIGVHLSLGDGTETVTVDLGMNLTNDMGGNTFTTDTQSPWYQNQDYDVSYCGVFNGMGIEVKAVGNTWTYVPLVGGPDYNQGVVSTGTFPSSPSLTITPSVNFVVSTSKPPHRALFGTSGPPNPWNVSTAAQFGTSGTPSIKVVP